MTSEGEREREENSGSCKERRGSLLEKIRVGYWQGDEMHTMLTVVVERSVDFFSSQMSICVELTTLQVARSRMLVNVGNVKGNAARLEVVFVEVRWCCEVEDTFLFLGRKFRAPGVP